MVSLGIIGHRGMVGQVLLKRMKEENDFSDLFTTFFSTSIAGESSPEINGKSNAIIQSATNLELLMKMDILLCAQGSEYSEEFYPQLKTQGFNGFWIDASSYKRNDAESLLVLDPLNKQDLIDGINNGAKLFCGSNCTVSLLLLALQGAIDKGVIESVSSMSYQAASGAGAKNLEELFAQIQFAAQKLNHVHHLDTLDKEQELRNSFKENLFPKKEFGMSLLGNCMPFIDQEWEEGSSKEEWKGGFESLKILKNRGFSLDGLCVRVPTFRAHAQGLTINLKEELTPFEFEEILSKGNEWVQVVPNNKSDSLKFLSPLHVSNSLTISIGRIKKIKGKTKQLTAYTVGDQLLWGAAEPLRRMVRLILSEKYSIDRAH